MERYARPDYQPNFSGLVSLRLIGSTVRVADNGATNTCTCGLAWHDDHHENALCTSRRYRDCRGLGAFFNPNRRSTGTTGSDVAFHDNAGRADTGDDHNDAGYDVDFGRDHRCSGCE